MHGFARQQRFRQNRSSHGSVALLTAILTSAVVFATHVGATELDNETTTTNAAASLKRYSNAEFAFSFDYPDTYTLVEARSTQANDALLIVKLLSRDENVPIARERTPGSFSVEVFANPQRLQLNEWLDQHGWPFGGERTATTASIANTSALQVSTGRMFAPNRFIYVATNAHVLRISPIASESASILESFKLSR